ncbi:hypothetical protein FA95DRAFT_1575419 [Auriscalpium vulgare]|uniref:Uncharacterized protein n=1 Tax=Auriscalpium vulgare TaxID=40419 RepID=A0ACB8RGA1_9AGAM|nr:hypothetical protein FA95DRAFT_1575419 [Auriscalpium vulgare]
MSRSSKRSSDAHNDNPSKTPRLALSSPLGGTPSSPSHPTTASPASPAQIPPTPTLTYSTTNNTRAWLNRQKAAAQKNPPSQPRAQSTSTTQPAPVVRFSSNTTSTRNVFTLPSRSTQTATPAVQNARAVSITKRPNGRRGQRSQTVAIQRAPQPVPDANTESAPDPPSGVGNDLVEPSPFTSDDGSLVQPEDVPPASLPKKPSRAANISKLLDWIPYRDQYLEELIRQDGFAGRDGGCVSCWTTTSAKGEYRCTDCTGERLLCAQCIVAEHHRLPLHRLECWNGSFFKKVSLLSLGFCLFLGHEGRCCPTPYTTSLLVGDTGGFHSINVAFCRCYHRGDIPIYMQLLAIRWYPATPINPTTAFTFDLLDTYHELSLQGNVNLYDFTLAIEHRTDNTGLNSPSSRYRQLALVVRQWRFLKMLKRGGRGHDPAGVDATSPGALAVECPACPRPGVNLPDGWESAGPDQSWLYEQVFAVDANFRLKLKDRGLRDIELMPGWAYYVEESAYQRLIKNHVDVPEPKYCDSQHSAVAKAGTLKTIGYSVSGVGAVVCGRHSFVRKNAVADLQKGERYVTMDYIVLSTLANTAHRRLTISYDIACQWSVNFAKRIKQFPAAMRLDLSKIFLRTAVPKFHIAAHGPKCQGAFNLNYMDKTGRTYGEGVESGWSYTNGLATSTREMSSGGRHENLNDHWGAWNWRKAVGFGAYFQKALREALLWQGKSSAQFLLSSATFPDATINKWLKMVTDWEADKKKPDPYAEPSYSVTSADVRLQLANEEAEATARGRIAPHSMSPSIFIQTGLDLEDQQRNLKLRVIELKGIVTSYEKADLQEKRNSLARRIENWRVIQDIYMPFVAAL